MTIAANIAIIHAKAVELDGIIAQFRAAKEAIDAAESEIRIARGFPVAKVQQERLALAAHSMMVELSLPGMTVAQLAANAWEGVA